MTQTFFLSQLRSLALIVIAYCAGRGWLSPQDSGALTAILVPIGAIAGPWIWSIYANINAKLVHADSAAAKVAAIEKTNPVDALNAASRLAEKVATVLMLGFAASVFLAVAPTMAQTTARPARVAAPSPQLLPLTGNGTQDLANLLKRFTIAPAPTTPDEIQSTNCDLTILSKLTVDNAVPLLQKCMQAVGNGVAAPLVADTQKALDSAKAFNCGDNPAPGCTGNGMAIACLVPALSLFKAAEGTPAVKDASGTVTTSAIPAGVITIGEKLDEFVQSGGPSNCKTVIQRVTAGLVAAAMTP